MSWSFLLTSLIICIAPGPGAIYTVTSGLTRGARAGVLAALACTLGILPHLLAAVTGMAALLRASGLAFEVVRYAGVAYLLWMAWSTWRDTGALTVDGAPRAVRWTGVLRSGVTMNLLNPKLTIFFFAFLPQFVAPGGSALPSMLALSAVFMAMTFAVFVVYGVFAALLRDRVLTRPRVVTALRRAFALGFVGVGARLAVEPR